MSTPPGLQQSKTSWTNPGASQRSVPHADLCWGLKGTVGRGSVCRTVAGVRRDGQARKVWRMEEWPGVSLRLPRVVRKARSYESHSLGSCPGRIGPSSAGQARGLQSLLARGQPSLTLKQNRQGSWKPGSLTHSLPSSALPLCGGGGPEPLPGQSGEEGAPG